MGKIKTWYLHTKHLEYTRELHLLSVSTVITYNLSLLSDTANASMKHSLTSASSDTVIFSIYV
jgi:hypothetical protein